MAEVHLTVSRDSNSAILDLFEGDSVALNERFSDIQTFEVVGGYSQQFRVPATENNIAFFGIISDPNFTGFDFKTKLDATLSVDTVPIAVGHCQVKKTYTVNDNWSEIELVFYSSVPNLATAVGDKKISDLTDLSNLNHEMSTANVLTPPANVLWSLTERGQKLSEVSGSGGRPIMSVDSPLYVGDLTPCVNGLYLWQQIFSDAGFSYNSEFIDEQLLKYWLVFINNRYVLTEEGTDTAFYLDYEDGMDDVISYGEERVANDLAEFYDNGGNVGANSIFTAPFTGQFNFRVFVKGRVNAPALHSPGSIFDHYVKFMFKDGSGVLKHDVVFNIYNTATSTHWFNYAQDFSLFLTEGETLQMSLTNANPPSEAADLSFDRGTGWQLISTSEPLQGGTIDIPLNAPDYKQIDFIRDILKMHNLVFVPSKTDPKTINITPFVDYIGSGGTEDWTPKLDTSKDIVIYPTTDEQKRNLLFTYKAGGEYLSDLFVKQGNRIYGDYKIDNTGNDFAQGDNKVELELRSTPCNEIPNTPIPVPKFIDQNGVFVNPYARMLFNGGTTGIALWDDVDEQGEIIELPIISHYSQFNATLDDEDLNFAPETPLQNITAIPFNTLYNAYWRRYYNELYSDQSRIMEAYFDLSTVDFMQLDYSKQLWIRDSYWRLLQVDNFVVGGDMTTKCVLAKIVSSVQDCTYTPVSVGTNGEVTFEDANGDTSVGSEACCIRYGYNWTGSLCRAFVGTGRPNDNTSASSAAPVVDFAVPQFGRSAIVAGEDVAVTNRGVHFGQSTGTDGQQQGGIIVLGGSGDYAVSGDKIIISDGGADIFLPEKTAMSCLVTVVAQQYTGGVIVDTHTAVFQLEMFKKNTTAGYNTPVVISEVGDMGSLDLSVDVTTNTSLHRVRVGSTGGTYPINDVKITATLIYSMSRL
jgi:hypothetical protein